MKKGFNLKRTFIQGYQACLSYFKIKINETRRHKNRLTLQLLSFLFIATLLSGCITIFENYTFNSDGSGTMEYKIDMSEFYSVMQSFSESKADDDLQIDQSFFEAARLLNTVKGISNIHLTGNSDKFIFGIKYDFADPAALNEAMSFILQKKANQKEYLSFKRKNITRHGVISSEFSKDNIIGKEEMELDEGMIKDIFSRIKYQISMNFYNPVRTVKTKANYTVNKNNLTLETNFEKLLENHMILETTVKLR